jgi:hypothetical protein
MTLVFKNGTVEAVLKTYVRGGLSPGAALCCRCSTVCFSLVMATDFLSQVSFPLVHFYTYSKSFHTSEIPTQTPAPVNTTHSIPSVVCSNTSTMITSPYPPTPMCLFSRTLRWPPRLGEAQELRIRPQSVQELSVILTPELTRTLWKRSWQRWQRE